MLKTFLVATALALGAAGTAQAGVYTFTASGTGSDGALAGSATITTENGMLSVVLNNTESNMRSAGQALSDISFILGAAPGKLGSYTAFGQLVNTSYSTDSVIDTTGTINHWALGNSGSTITLEAAGTLAKGKPKDMIIGPGQYDFNKGIANFNPYILDTATFIFSASRVTSDTVVKSASFSFGTGPDTFLPGTPGTSIPVPEPSSFVLLGTGLLALGMVVAGRRRIF
ncbi:PEP-CTERM sorting domain-containing protein [Acidiphilium sp.]|uniref:PEP-CTERM sorting domain-containing protein n=1 Tax=Acidiphilium sp. TaxID=527 RepID=UPI003D07CFCE